MRSRVVEARGLWVVFMRRVHWASLDATARAIA
jgi:hypothetical protein